MAVSFHAYFKRHVKHVTVRIFSGKDKDHRSYAGVLCFSDEEFTHFESMWTLKYDMSPGELEHRIKDCPCGVKDGLIK